MKTLTLTPQRILKIADIEKDELPTDFNNWLYEDIEPVYKDQVLKDDIFNITDVIERNQAEGDLSETIDQTIDTIKVFCDTHECCYFRIIN